MSRNCRLLLPFRPYTAGAWLRAAEIAALAALLAAALPRTAAAQAVRSTAVEARHQAAPRERLETGGFPDPFWLSLLTAVLAGVAGAAAAERVAGRGPAGRPGAAGVLEKLVVGPVSAVALLGINPPDAAWPALVGTAAAGGAAAQALLLAAAHARRALAAELRRDAADEGARRTVVLAGEQMETLRRLAVERAGMIGNGSAPCAADWERALDVYYAERARVELLRVARGPAARPRPGDTPHSAGEARDEPVRHASRSPPSR
jgi:hypothetical protein